MRLPHSILNVHLARRLKLLLKRAVTPGSYEGDWTTLEKPGDLSFVEFSQYLRALAGLLEKSGFEELGSAIRYSNTFDPGDGRMHVGRAHSGIRQLTKYLGEFDAGEMRKPASKLRRGDTLLRPGGEEVVVIALLPGTAKIRVNDNLWLDPEESCHVRVPDGRVGEVEEPWKRASDLRVGDVVITDDGGTKTRVVAVLPVRAPSEAGDAPGEVTSISVNGSMCFSPDHRVLVEA